jgi:hypothetical protein
MVALHHLDIVMISIISCQLTAFQNKKHVQSEGARTAAYEMSAELRQTAKMTQQAVQAPANTTAASAAIEDRQCAVRHPRLGFYKSIYACAHGLSKIGTNAYHLAALLLPSLLSAACSNPQQLKQLLDGEAGARKRTKTLTTSCHGMLLTG